MSSDEPTLDANTDNDKPTNVRWIVFALTFVTSWMLYVHRYTFGIIKADLAADFGLDKAELGYLDTAFSITYMLFQVPAGLLADAVGVHFLLGGLILVWSLALGLNAWAPNKFSLYALRAVFGAGQSGAFALVSRITRTWFPSSVRSTVQGCTGVFAGRFGGVCANVFVATVVLGILAISWQNTLLMLAAAGILQAVVFLAVFRNSVRNHWMANQAEKNLVEEVDTSSDDGETTTPQRMKLSEMLSRMSPRAIGNLFLVIAASTFSTIADNIYSSWIPFFLQDEHNLNYKEMGLIASLPLIGGACGGAFGGFLNDYAIHKTGNRRWSRSLIGGFGKGMAAVTLVVTLFFYEKPLVFCSLLFVVKFFADISLATRWGVVTDIGGEATATVFSFNNSMATVGAAIAPAMYGFVAREWGWLPVFYIAVGAYILCSLSWLLVNCTIPVFGKDPDFPRIVD